MMQAELHGSGGAIQNCGQFFCGQVAPVMERQNFSVLGREALERQMKRLRVLVRFKLEMCLAGLKLRQLNGHLLAADFIPHEGGRLMVSDAIEPRTKSPGDSEGFQPLKRINPYLLMEVQGQIIDRNQAAQVIQNWLLVTIHEVQEGVGIARLRLDDSKGFIESGEFALFGIYGPVVHASPSDQSQGSNVRFKLFE
jgi:hypothetical protein